LQGFTRLLIHPQRGIKIVNGLITGLHDSSTSHLTMLYALTGQELIRAAYREASQPGTCGTSSVTAI
jgi:S-adenosylmethionine:tRNA ribosyltransferase-isomerase